MKEGYSNPEPLHFSVTLFVGLSLLYQLEQTMQYLKAACPQMFHMHCLIAKSVLVFYTFFFSFNAFNACLRKGPV